MMRRNESYRCYPIKRITSLENYLEVCSLLLQTLLVLLSRVGAESEKLQRRSLQRNRQKAESKDRNKNKP